MTPERLKELAEAAELVSWTDGRWEHPDDQRFIYLPSDPALLPLIAERLVERAKEHVDYSDTKWLTMMAVSSASERAEAAYEVLKDGT